jgi:hypothetical protein
MKHVTTIVAAALVCVSVASEAACRGPEPVSAPGGAGASGAGASGAGASGAGASGAGAGEHRAPAANGTGSRVVAKEIEGEELLALAGDQLLLWSVQGRARLMNVNGEWSDLALPLVGVREARAKGADVLLVGQDPATHAQAVSWVNLEGKELGRWALPKEAGFGAALDAAAMQITIGSTVSQLEPGGTLGAPRSLPEDAHRSSFGGPRWVGLAGSSITCHGADLSMASSAPGHCRRAGAGGWEFEGPFVAPPIECGAWLLVSSSADGKALEVRDQASGQPRGRAKLSAPPLLACTGPNEVLLGTQELATRRLPSLDIIWRHPLGKNPVRQLAVTDNFIAYVLSGSFDLNLLPKPVAQPH